MTIPRTVPIALLISAPIFACLQLPKQVAAFPGESPFAKAVVAYLVVALLSIAAMATFGEHRWEDFGFKRSVGRWGRLALYALALGTLSGLAVKLSPGKPLDEAMKGMAQPQIPLLLLIASAVEELAVRGWLQGFLEPLRGRLVRVGPFTMSVPVLTGGLAFGAWHLTVIGFDVWTGCIIVVFTTLLGWLAGTSRERTGSLFPAIVTHVAANVGGIVAGIFYMIVHLAFGGSLPAVP